MKRIGLGLCAALMAAALAGCGGGDDDETKGGTSSSEPGRKHSTSGESWTVMVYMVADNDLEPFALQDLGEMADVGSTDRFNLLVQADRAEGYAADGVANLPDWTSTKRMRVGAGAIEVLEDIGEVNMGDPAELGNFIAWAAKTSPADRYAIVFWDHGGAWIGFGPDHSTPNSDLLSLPELRKAISDGMDRAKIDQFALIGFDACLMSSFETAMLLRPYGEYLLASEETEPGHGWDYHSMQALKDDPKTGPVAIAKDVMAGFEGQAKAEQTHATITLALTDLYDPMDALAKAVEGLTGIALDKSIAEVAPVLGKERSATLKYGDAPNPQQATQMIDLGDFASNLAGADPAFDSARKAIESALDDAIIARVAGATKTKSTGLSIYFPPQAAFYNPSYDEIEEVLPWQKLLKAYYDAAASVATTPTFVNPDHLAEVSAGPQGDIVVAGQLVDGAAPLVAAATLNFGVIDPESNALVFVGDVPADVDEAGLVAGSWDATVLAIQQGEAVDYGYLSVNVEEGLLVTTIPFAYVAAPGAEPELVLLSLAFDEKGTEISSTFYLLTEGGPGELTPAPGATIQALLLVAARGGAPEWSIASEVTFDPSGALDFALAPLESGVAAHMMLTATDFAGNGDFVSYEGIL